MIPSSITKLLIACALLLSAGMGGLWLTQQRGVQAQASMVTAISPTWSQADQTINVTVQGNGFMASPPLVARLSGTAGIFDLHYVVVQSSVSFTTVISSGLPTGIYDLVVINNGETGILHSAFTIVAPGESPATATPTATASPTPSATHTATATATHTATPTYTPVPPTATATQTPAPPTATATQTPLPSRFALAGRVTSGGAGLAGVTIALGTSTTTTDSTGHYQFANLPAGNYTLTPALSGYSFSPSSRNVALQRDSSGQNFSASALINPRIVMSPLETTRGGSLNLQGSGFSANGQLRHQIVDANGNVAEETSLATAQGSFSYRHTVANSAPLGSSSYRVQDVTTGTWSNTIVYSVEPNPTYSITGRVVDGDNQPVSGVTMALDAGHATQTGGDGRYTLQGVAAGSYTLTPAHADYSFTPASRSVTLPPAQSDIDFVATRVANPVVDLSISLYNNPTSAQRNAYEQIIRYFADGVYESSNAAHRIGTVRIYTNAGNWNSADVQWSERCHPRAHVSGFGRVGWQVFMCDRFAGGMTWDGVRLDYNYLERVANDPVAHSDDTRHQNGGYTFAHEWGHYFYSLRDEYVGAATCTGKPTQGPCRDDVPVEFSLMNSSWNATGGNYRWLNFSTRLNDTQRTAQYRTYLANAWEFLLRHPSADPRDPERLLYTNSRLYYPELAAVAPNLNEAPRIDLVAGHNARGSLRILWNPSGSATLQSTPVQQRVLVVEAATSAQLAHRAAAQWLVSQAPLGSSAFALVSYGAEANVVQPMTLLNSEADRQALLGQLAALQPSATRVVRPAATQALRLAREQLGTQPAGDNAVYLFTGGAIEDGSRLFQELTAYRAAQIPIFSFDHRAAARSATLPHTIAQRTGGSYAATPQLPAALFALMAAEEQQSPLVSSVIAQGERANAAATPIQLTIDSALQTLDLLVVQPESAAKALQLRDPQGNRYALSECQTLLDYTVCRQQVPAAQMAVGRWAIESSNSNEAFSLSYRISGLYNGRVPLTSSLDQLNGRVFHYPEAIAIAAALQRELPVAQAGVTAHLTLPDGTSHPVTLRDDGLAPDGIADDGIYSALLGYRQFGRYTLNVSFDNREGRATTSAAGLNLAPAPPIGDQPIEEAGEALGENFQRTLVATFYMAGLQADDHGDTAASATPLLSNNSDVAGSIDLAGDRDRFRLTAERNGTFVVRVSDLALDMYPRLRLLAADGQTERSSHTWTGSGYLWTSFTLAAGETLYAEVSHYDANAVGGLYKISVGPPLVGEAIRGSSVYLPLVRR